MALKEPSIETIRELARHFGFDMGEEDLAEFRDMVAGGLAMYRPLESIPDYLPEVTYPRTPGHRPDDDEDPLHAWYVKSSVKGAADGRLAGKQVVLKDNICLAGVPMMNGASTLEGYVPDVDATVVTRILDAGGRDRRQGALRVLLVLGRGHVEPHGPDQEPAQPGVHVGRLVVRVRGAGRRGRGSHGHRRRPGRVDPGAERVLRDLRHEADARPRSLHGDDADRAHHRPCGPHDGNGRRQRPAAGGHRRRRRARPPPVRAGDRRLHPALDRGAEGMRVGVVTEGFGQEFTEPDVDDAVREAIARLGGLGCKVEEVSIPMHAIGLNVWAPIAIEGSYEMVFKGDALGTGWRGLYVSSLGKVHSAWRAHANSFSDTLKLGMLTSEFVIRNYGRHYYAKAQNLSRKLREEYDRVFEACDVLVMPTTPMKAPLIPAADASRGGAVRPGVRLDHEHRAVRRDRPPGDVGPVRHAGGPAGGHAGRGPALGRVVDLPAGGRIRTRGGLDVALSLRRRGAGRG